jgi:uncharacterized membrane protein
MALLATLMVAYALFFGWLSFRRYWAYEMHALDMGNMGQAAWNTVHGHPFFFTNMRLPYNLEAWNTTTRLSFHVEYLFPVISLVYLIYPHPESLLALQTVAIALGAIPVFLLARDGLRNTWLALLFALAYLLFPTLESMNLFEFHPVALATPLLLLAFLFARRRQYLPFAICLIAAVGTKEEIGLVAALFGLYVALFNRSWRVGLATAAVGIVWSLVATSIIEHHYLRPGTLTYFHVRYAYLGHGIHGVAHTVLHNPGIFGTVLFKWTKLAYLLILLAPVGFTALLAPGALLLGLPTFLLNVLSNPGVADYTDFHMYSGFGTDSAELISVVMIAAILGTAAAIRLLRSPTARGRAMLGIGILVAAGSLWSQHAYGFTPIGDRFQLPSVGAHQHLADRFVNMVPASAPVSTQDQLDPHLSSRHYVYLFEDTGRNPPLVAANYILLDASAPTFPLPSYQIHDEAEKWIHTKGWGVAAADDGLILIERGAHSRTIPTAFYRFAYSGNQHVPHPLKGQSQGLRVLGYDAQRQALVNHHTPDLAYTFYFRPARPPGRNMQPVVYELIDGKLAACSQNALGLAWLPTSKWKTGQRYLVRMGPLETDWESPATAHLYFGLSPVRSTLPTCAQLWRGHGKIWPVGTLDIAF